MRGFQHILFPIDFSERCRAVRPFVRSVAARFGAKVTLLHALDVPKGFYAGIGAGYPITIDWDAMRLGAERELATFFESPEAAIPGGVDRAVVIGEPAAEITEFAEKYNLDLIMMPTLGYGKFRGLLLGSVTAKVLHDVACPVWTAAHTEDPSLPVHVKCENILCALDLTPDGLSLLQHSVELAALFKARLRLVHAIPAEQSGPDGRFDVGVFERFLLDSAREGLARMQKDAGADVQTCVEAGAVSKIVRAAALEQQADLVLIGRGKIHERLGRLRTNAYSIIRDSPCPVTSL